jgi:hypothetical protein
MEIPRDKAHFEDNPKVLSPPLITQPLYGCAKIVNVTGYVPEATLDLEVDGAVVVANFPGHSPTPWGASIKLPATFKTNQAPPQKVRARQSFGGEASDWTAVVTVRDHAADFPAGLPGPNCFRCRSKNAECAPASTTFLSAATSRSLSMAFRTVRLRARTIRKV